MEFYQFNRDNGKKVTMFDSNFIISPITKTKDNAQISCIYLERFGIIGYHQATVPQLLFAVDGEGFVRNEKEEYVKVQAGDAVFWTKGEWHETKTDNGLTAIVIESETLNPAQFGFKK